MKRPATQIDMGHCLAIFTAQVRHNCGSPVFYQYHSNGCVFKCLGCDQKWSARVIDGMSAAALAMRFHVDEPAVAEPAPTLVWSFKDGKQFTTFTDDPYFGLPFGGGF